MSHARRSGSSRFWKQWTSAQAQKIQATTNSRSKSGASSKARPGKLIERSSANVVDPVGVY
jgi:hypothetical protein